MRTQTLCVEFERILPRILARARFVFRFVACPHTQDELIAETVALSFHWFCRLRQRNNKNPLTFVSALASYAARAARSGRRLCGHERASDILSPVAQRQHDFCVRSLSACEGLSVKAFGDAIPDNSQTPVADQVAFRADFPAWLGTLDQRRQALIEAMSRGERTCNLAQAFHVSAGRIAQLRREFLAAWLAFTDPSPL